MAKITLSRCGLHLRPTRSFELPKAFSKAEIDELWRKIAPKILESCERMKPGDFITSISLEIGNLNPSIIVAELPSCRNSQYEKLWDKIAEIIQGAVKWH